MTDPKSDAAYIESVLKRKGNTVKVNTTGDFGKRNKHIRPAAMAATIDSLVQATQDMALRLNRIEMFLLATNTLSLNMDRPEAERMPAKDQAAAEEFVIGCLRTWKDTL